MTNSNAQRRSVSESWGLQLCGDEKLRALGSGSMFLLIEVTSSGHRESFADDDTRSRRRRRRGETEEEKDQNGTHLTVEMQMQ